MSDTVNVDVPTVGESISEVQIGQWLKNDGDWVKEGEDLVEIETEKASVHIPAPASGILESILKQSEEFAAVGDTIASIRPSEKPAGEGTPGGSDIGSAASANETSPSSQASTNSTKSSAVASIIMPAAARLLAEHGLTVDQVPATGPGGRLLKEDVLAFVRGTQSASITPPTPVSAKQSPPPPAVQAPIDSRRSPSSSLVTDGSANRGQEVKPLSMLRRTIASRLVEAQQTAALLTTFNEIDMQPTMAIRKKYKDAFVERHGVKLGFMSFFAKAAVEALRRYPAVNAQIEGDNMVFRHYQDIGIAIGGGKGLVVPVLRNVEQMSFADVECSISEFAKQAAENRLQPEDLIGGTFTISNGGVYGSLLSTPIVNPPQSGILGLHSIQERPVAVNGEVVIRPMMYIALTYDHRIVDGREAVGFLKTIKEVIEDPARLFLEL